MLNQRRKGQESDAGRQNGRTNLSQKRRSSDINGSPKFETRLEACGLESCGGFGVCGLGRVIVVIIEGLRAH